MKDSPRYEIMGLGDGKLTAQEEWEGRRMRRDERSSYSLPSLPSTSGTTDSFPQWRIVSLPEARALLNRTILCRRSF